jgi:hypothetical protein
MALKSRVTLNIRSQLIFMYVAKSARFLGFNRLPGLVRC